MDRNKSVGGSRSSKNKIGAPHHGSELYALGTKGSSSRDDKVKSVSDRKRDGGPSLSTVSKKPKLVSGNSGGRSNIASTSGSIGSDNSCAISMSSITIEPWEQLAIDCDPVDLTSSVISAFDQMNSDVVIGLVCGAIKLLSSSMRGKNDNILIMSLLFLARKVPTVFCNDIITSALVSILKRDNQIVFKGRLNPTAHVIATNILAHAYRDKRNWPEVFVRIYIDDASSERSWVDNVECAPFVENICTAFGTRIPPKSMLQPELNTTSQTASTSSPVLTAQSTATIARDATITIDDDSNDNSLHNPDNFRSETLFDCPVQDRYSNSTHIVEKYVIDTVKEQFNRRQQQDCSTRNFLKFLSSTTGIGEVRALSVSRLELWIHNQKLMKPAQELLTYIYYNLTGLTAKDNEVLASLVKMRLKSKPLISIYMTCLKEVINLQPNILYTALKYVVQNELSNARNPNNMGMLANMFQTKPEQSARYLAEIYQEFLLQRDDCLRTLRVFLRELVKMLRYEMNLVEFCKVLLSNRSEIIPQIQQSEYKDRIFQQMIDLTCLCMFLTISPQVREANVSVRSGRDIKNNSIITHFYNQVSQIQLHSLTWMHEIVPTIFRPLASEYGQALHKVLLLDAPEQYSKCDQWPPEPERALLLRLVYETPVHQDSVLRIILIGITKEIPFSVPDTIEVVEQTVKRATSLKSNYPAVEATKLEIIDFLFSMAEYHHPENIALPIGYEPPKLAISVLYWKVWNILLILSAHNASTFGSFCWEQYPMLRALMEMCITNQFHDVKFGDEEIQVSNLEKVQILEFESHLAAATSKAIITEHSSLLLSQLMLMDPMGVARRPPNHVLDQLQQLNATHKLGHLLCRCRKPDLLLDIIQRHGTTQSMPWLADLVQNSDGDFNHLPVQCLCEFLLSHSSNINIENQRDADLLEYLKNILRDPNYDRQTVYEVIEYFFRRLASTLKQPRILAINGLKLLLQTSSPTTQQEQQQQQKSSPLNTNNDETDSDWLLLHLPQIPHFLHVRPLIIVQLRAACQIENKPDLIMIYIQFIAANTLHDSVPDMLDHIMDMAQLIVERSTMFHHIVPKTAAAAATTTTLSNANDDKKRLQTLNCLFIMFNNYLIKLREHKSPYEWADYSDLLMIHFDDHVVLPIHLNVAHAFVILLTHSSPALPASIPILDFWFSPGRQIPLAYTIDTNEPVQLLPDWLKLKMIRSSIDCLVEAAMYDLTPDQIVLFLQNFGTPIDSMSKLLALLDHAVIKQFDVVKNSILNKAYLAQLIEIQQARGAKSGHITLQALELNAHSTQSSNITTDTSKISLHTLESVNFDQFEAIIASDKPSKLSTPSIIQSTSTTSASCASSSSSSSLMVAVKPSEPLITFSNKNLKDIEEIIDLILKTKNLNKSNNAHFRRFIQQLIRYRRQRKQQNQQQQQQQCDIILTKALMHLARLAESPHGHYFFQNILQKVHVFTLFRGLLNYIPEKLDDCNYISQVIDKLTQIMIMKPTPDNTILIQYLKRKQKFITQHILDATMSQNVCNRNNFLKILMNSSLNELEKKGKICLNNMIVDRETDYIVGAIAAALSVPPIKLENDIKDFSTTNVSKLILSSIHNKHGILIDWLSEIDPEIIKINKKQQIDLLFKSKLDNRTEFRYYILSLLCHQANWSSLFGTVNTILEEFKNDYDPTAVLNFIEALTQNPKLWQGRDKSTPKHEQIGFVLILNAKQVNVFVQYIFHEILNDYVKMPSNRTKSLIYGGIIGNGKDDIESINEKLNARIHLLFKIIDMDSYDLRELIQFIRNYKYNEIIKFKFLQQLYVMQPSIKFLDKESTIDVCKSNVQTLKNCTADEVINYIITTIASPQPQKDLNVLMDSELLIRKLAASHPSLFLRQLPVLSSLMQGKAHLSLNVLRSESYLLRFLQCLRVLELLQPLIFDELHKKSLQDTLDCYLILFKHHIRAKEVYSILARFIEFLQSYINVSPTSALIFIEKYIDLLKEVSGKCPNFTPLRKFMQGISLVKNQKWKIKVTEEEFIEEGVKQEFDLKSAKRCGTSSGTGSGGGVYRRSTQDIDIDEPSTSGINNYGNIGSSVNDLDIESRSVASYALSNTNLKQQPHYFDPHFHSLIQIIQNSNSEEIILQPLIEIDNMTHKRSTGCLDELFDRLLELIFSPSTQIRTKAYSLLIRHLKYNPGNLDINKCTLNAYLQCLRDTNSTISTTALNNLIDMVICLQEYAIEILNTVFELGITSKLNSASQIKKCIQILKLQHAC